MPPLLDPVIGGAPRPPTSHLRMAPRGCTHPCQLAMAPRGQTAQVPLSDGRITPEGKLECPYVSCCLSLVALDGSCLMVQGHWTSPWCVQRTATTAGWLQVAEALGALLGCALPRRMSLTPSTRPASLCSTAGSSRAAARASACRRAEIPPTRAPAPRPVSLRFSGHGCWPVFRAAWA